MKFYFVFLFDALQSLTLITLISCCCFLLIDFFFLLFCFTLLIITEKNFLLTQRDLSFSLVCSTFIHQLISFKYQQYHFAQPLQTFTEMEFLDQHSLDSSTGCSTNIHSGLFDLNARAPVFSFSLSCVAPLNQCVIKRMGEMVVGFLPSLRSPLRCYVLLSENELNSFYCGFGRQSS